jgi:Glycosyltransferase family 92
MSAYLAACACLGFDVPYLVEWLEFHRMVGVERFFLYNNGDREGQREMLAPYVADGIVDLHEWPTFPPQVSAHNNCIELHRDDARWIAFIDTDEFLFAPDGRALPEVLADYEKWPGVGVGRVFYGPSGHRLKPDGLVIESYLRKLPDHRASTAVKSIVDPTRTGASATPHSFDHPNGFIVDERHRPIEDPLWPQMPSFSVERLRINHYWTKSEEELEEKFGRARPDTGQPYPERRTPTMMREWDRKSGEHDDAILRFVPGVKKRLGPARDRAGA